MVDVHIKIYIMSKKKKKNDDIMTCFVEMVNCSTGEIYYHRRLGYSFAIGLPNDVGMSKVKDIVESAIKGARVKNEPLQLRLMFFESLDTPDLPFTPEDREIDPYTVRPF